MFLPRISGLTLTSNGQYEYSVNRGDVAIQRDIAVRIATDNQFIHAYPHRSTNQRVILKHIDRLDNFRDSRMPVAGFIFGKMIQATVEIVRNPDSEFNLRHVRA